jgi:penicillin-binding protein 1C
MRDNWCVGFTTRFTVGVWVGNFSGAPMRDVSGVSGAAPIWRDVIHFLHAADVPPPAPVPSGLVHESVRFEPPLEAERDEWFLRGTEMAVVKSSATGAASTPRIRYPSPDTIIALDPDLPPGRQRVVFEAAPIVPGLGWRSTARRLPTCAGARAGFHNRGGTRSSSPTRAATWFRACCSKCAGIPVRD